MWFLHLISLLISTSCITIQFNYFLLNVKNVIIRQHVQWKRVLIGVRSVMVFNATFNNISVIFWQSVLLVEETGVPLY